MPLCTSWMKWWMKSWICFLVFKCHKIKYTMESVTSCCFLLCFIWLHCQGFLMWTLVKWMSSGHNQSRFVLTFDLLPLLQTLWSQKFWLLKLPGTQLNFYSPYVHLLNCSFYVFNKLRSAQTHCQTNINLTGNKLNQICPHNLSFQNHIWFCPNKSSFHRVRCENILALHTMFANFPYRS